MSSKNASKIGLTCVFLLVVDNIRQKMKFMIELLHTGMSWFRQVLFELLTRQEGCVFLKTLQLNITANNTNNSFALAA